MSVPIPLCDNFDAAAVKLTAKASKDAAQTRRLLALAEIVDRRGVRITIGAGITL